MTQLNSKKPHTGTKLKRSSTFFGQSLAVGFSSSLEFSRSKIDTGDALELNRNLNLPESVITSGVGKAMEKAESSSNYDTIKRQINKPLKGAGLSQVDLVSEIYVPETVLQPFTQDF
jgi:hypothetical protein